MATALTKREKNLLNQMTPGAQTVKLGDKVAAAIASSQPATATTAGTVLKAATVANAAGANPTKAEFDALLTSLRAAGILT